MIKVEVGTKCLLHVSNSSFCLSVRLWMVSCRHLQVSAEQSEKRAPKSRSKLGITVGNDGSWHAVVLEHLSIEEFGNLRCCVLLLARNEVRPLGELVHDDEYGVVAVARRR